MFILASFLNTVSAGGFRRMSEKDFCKFNETLKNELQELECNNLENWDKCATKIREIVQNSTFGTWGAVVIGNEKDIIDGRIDWHISSYSSEKCRLFINNGKNKMLIEVFRTGISAKDVYQDQKLWRSLQERHSSALTAIEVCPHSSLRNLVSNTWVKNLPHHRRHRRQIPQIQLHESARRLSTSFYDQTSHEWNVFIAKIDLNSTLSIGFEFPYYHYNAQPGYCIAKSQDGYMVIAVMSEYFNDTFNEFLFLL
uniref:Uncharacterized protein n=1 Tax=Panagrolaimus davidi TaxID=227884 RepID=A0A914PDL1_9BILA